MWAEGKEDRPGPREETVVINRTGDDASLTKNHVSGDGEQSLGLRDC